MKLAHRTLIMLAILLLLPAILLAGQSWRQSQNTSELRVSVLDVGEGDSILVQTPSGRTLLIDSGGSRRPDGGRRGGDGGAQSSDEDSIGERVLMPELRRLGVGEINVLLITHPHGDHIGGMPAVLRDEKVDAVLDGTTLPYPSLGYRRLAADIRGRKLPYAPARRGDLIDFGDGVHATVLNPPSGTFAYGTAFDDKTINDYSAVVRLSYGHTVIMLDGDAEQEAEDDMLAHYPAGYLKATALKVGHHGSRNASSDEWLSAVGPSYAAISCGQGNPFHHPHQEALDRLSEHGIRIFRTDRNGTVTWISDGKTVSVSSER